MKWRVDFPQLQSVIFGGGSFGIVKSFSMSNLTSLQSIEFGQGSFGGNHYGNIGAPSFSLTGIDDWMKRGIDLPQLQSVVFDKDAFQYAKSFSMSNLTSLQSIEFGNSAFKRSNSFVMSKLTSLQSLILGDHSFKLTVTFEISALTSLQSIDFGDWCFSGYNDNTFDRGVSLFSLIGITEWMKWEIDLPQLQSVKLGNKAFRGDYRPYGSEYGLNNNIVIMRSENERVIV